MKAPENILVRGVNWLGDAVMTMPALCALREAYPNASITVLTPAKLADLYAYQPAVSAVLTVANGESIRSITARIRAHRFDTGLILTNSIRAALPFWLAGIPRRIGLGGREHAPLLTDRVRPESGTNKIHKKSAPEIERACQKGHTPGTSTALTPKGLLPEDVHHIHFYMWLVAALGADTRPSSPELVVPEADLAAARQRFCLAEADAGNPLFGLNPGAEYGIAKRWPEDRFVNAAIEIQKRLNCRWIVLGGAGDRELAARIAGEIQAHFPLASGGAQAVANLAGQTTLKELCAVLQACRLVLTNDTGPMHIAAAVGTTVVVPFGSTSPELTGPGLPGSKRHRLLKASAACSPCFLKVCPIDFRCMNGISVSNVVSAVLDLQARQA